MPDGPIADAPQGFTEMCVRDRVLCMLGDGTATGRPELRPAPLPAFVKAINAEVNRHVTRRTDQQTQGVGEYWSRPSGPQPAGDCEDFAIEKRVRLTEAGFPADRMFYGVAFVRGLGLHTVLVLRLADGDYVLDSMTPHILRWQQSHYVWLRRQVAGAPLLWQRMSPETGISTLAVTRDKPVASPTS
jgi:predicted transglutaminase-like cysteine proteinase